MKSDNIPEDKYLLPDMNYKNGGFNMYSESDFYLAGYPSVDDICNEYEGERHVSSGKIKRVFNNFEFEHTLDTRPGSSGSPICLINNRYVIGIHKAGDKNTFINQGTFLGEIIDSLENDLITIRCRLEDLDRTIMIKVNPKDNISTIINKLNLDLDITDQLHYDGIVLKGEKTFQDYEIEDGDLIIIINKLTGG